MSAIEIRDRTFLLKTKNTSYLFMVNEYGHVEHIHYGKKVRIEDAEALRYKRTIPYGSLLVYPCAASHNSTHSGASSDSAHEAFSDNVAISFSSFDSHSEATDSWRDKPYTSSRPEKIPYFSSVDNSRERFRSDRLQSLSKKQDYPSSEYLENVDRISDQTYSLDNVLLEWSGSGRGDFRTSPIEIEFLDGTFTTDFLFHRYEIKKGVIPAETLPTAYDDAGGNKYDVTGRNGCDDGILDCSRDGGRSEVDGAYWKGSSNAGRTECDADIWNDSIDAGRVELKGAILNGHSNAGSSEFDGAARNGFSGACQDSCFSGAETLSLFLKEALWPLELQLIYTVFPEEDVITRRAVLWNRGSDPVMLHKMMSQMIDLPGREFNVLTLHGDWNAEANTNVTPLTYGRFVNESRTGSSSNRHNPALALADHRATEHHGEVYGFNLVYSGNHQTSVERSSRGFVRVISGIQPENFHWQLQPKTCFETPEAVLTYSNQGFNGMSHQFHRFVLRHIVRSPWRNRERPILINNWEAYMFDFNERKLMKLARQAKELGIELFVLDDGWFGTRNNDLAGLGDYEVNRKKLPSGLKGFSKKIEKLGMSFGLWFEPESINPNSVLYRVHPEYAIQIPGRTPVQGRHQLLLDFTNPAVQDYVVDNITRILDGAPIKYVKWDMNRHMSDIFSKQTHPGEFAHRYMIGLYQVLKRIFGPRPEILLEMCSSGGNRFDLGMLCFAAQIWASDDTDPIERLRIQKGLSYFYPQSSVGAHVSAAPHTQTLRNTPLSTRFNVAAFGAFGYEMDLTALNHVEREEIKDQIIFYKEHRALFQFGRFYRYDWPRPNQEAFSVVSEDQRQSIVVFATTLTKSGEENDWLRVAGLDADTVYKMRTRPQKVHIARFGHLINYVSPIKLKADGLALTLANRYYALPDGSLDLTACGSAFESGIGLNNQYIGTGYNSDIRMWGDFGSQMYVIMAQPFEEVSNEVDIS